MDVLLMVGQRATGMAWLARVDVTDPHVHAHKPYRLGVLPGPSTEECVAELTLDDLRYLHFVLTAELKGRGVHVGAGTDQGLQAPDLNAGIEREATRHET